MILFTSKNINTRMVAITSRDVNAQMVAITSITHNMWRNTMASIRAGSFNRRLSLLCPLIAPPLLDEPP